jgi:hypothetical protein
VFTPLFWYDHPEIAPARQKSYAFGAVLDLSSYMGTSYAGVESAAILAVAVVIMALIAI